MRPLRTQSSLIGKSVYRRNIVNVESTIWGSKKSRVCVTLASLRLGVGRQNRRLESSLSIIQEFIFWLVYCIFCMYADIWWQYFSLCSANRRRIWRDVTENEFCAPIFVNSFMNLNLKFNLETSLILQQILKFRMESLFCLEGR